MPLPRDVCRCLPEGCPRAIECAREVGFGEQGALAIAARHMCHGSHFEFFIPRRTPADIEHEVLLHRYLYYVLGRPALSDREYDKLEAHARSVLPASSPVHGVGSDSSSDYPADVVVAARHLAGLKD